jgi:hypothetical protein
MYVHTYIHTHVYTYTHIYIYIYTHTHRERQWSATIFKTQAPQENAGNRWMPEYVRNGGLSWLRTVPDSWIQYLWWWACEFWYRKYRWVAVCPDICHSHVGNIRGNMMQCGKNYWLRLQRKSEAISVHAKKIHGRAQVELHIFWNSPVNVGELVASRPDCLTPRRKRPQYALRKILGGVLGEVWTV